MIFPTTFHAKLLRCELRGRGRKRRSDKMSFPVEPSAPTLSLPPTRDSSERQPHVNRRSVPPTLPSRRQRPWSRGTTARPAVLCTLCATLWTTQRRHVSEFGIDVEHLDPLAGCRTRGRRASVVNAQVKVGFSQSTHARGARKLSTFLCGQNCGYSRRRVWTSLWITLWTAPFRHVRRSCPTNAMSSLQCTCAPRFGLRCLDRSPRPPRAWEGRRCADEKGSRGPRVRASPLSAPSRSAVPRRACSRRRRAHEA